MSEFVGLLYPLGLTILIEYPIVQLLWLLLKFYKQDKKSILVLFDNKLIIIPTLIVNILTNPAINIFARYMFYKTEVPQETIWTIISWLEVLIFVVEAVLYKYLLGTKWKNAFLLSFASNFVSYMSSFLL